MNKKQKIIKALIVLSSLVLVLLAIYLPLQLSGTLGKIDSAEELKELILSGGVYSYLIFFAIQVLQVVVLPIPAFISTLAGALVFGPWVASIISFIAIIFGSLVCFLLGRKLGWKLLIWVVGEEDARIWKEKLGCGKYAFFLMMLFPLFPDDILCIVAGAVTSMSTNFFLVTNLLTRPIAILFICFLGGGYVVPFSGWGIPIWIFIIVSCAILFYLSIRYQAKIEAFINKLARKFTQKEIAVKEQKENN
ncbi:MAG: TVP38/TMEM64 family protein [Clostridia bacterium]|nr:TVP38/TMEM64 family protein [Clostridia bacterium]